MIEDKAIKENEFREYIQGGNITLQPVAPHQHNKKFAASKQNIIRSIVGCLRSTGQPKIYRKRLYIH